MNKIQIKFVLFVLVIMFTGAICYAENNDTLNTDKKLDSIYSLQKKMYKTIKNEPLTGKNIGVELNILKLLFLDEAIVLSGGFSFFNIDRKAEIAFPIHYSKPEDPESVNEFTLDCHYRHFLGNTQNGFYLSGFTRYAHLSGYAGDNFEFLTSDTPTTQTTENKIGIGIGLGYRKFSYRGLYWGVSLNLGRYIIGENDKFHDGFFSMDNDSKMIFNMELLKFGWAF